MRLTDLRKPLAVAFIMVASVVYAGLVVHEFSLKLERGALRREQAAAGAAFVEDEAMLGTIWAHRHHPYDASWCPNYSASFRQGCAKVAGPTKTEGSGS